MAKDVKTADKKATEAKVESGKLTGNKSQKIGDKADNAAGKVQEQYGEKDQKSNRKLV